MSLRPTKSPAPHRLPATVALSADGVTAALEVSPVGNGAATLSLEDMTALWEDYATLWWTFRGTVPPKPFKGPDPRAGLVKLAKLVLRYKRLDALGRSGSIAFKDKDARNLRRDNVYAVAPHVAPAEEAARARATAAALRRMGFVRTPMPDASADGSLPAL